MDCVIVSDSESSELDMSTEALHTIELCRLKQWREHNTDFITHVSRLTILFPTILAIPYDVAAFAFPHLKVVTRGRATRYIAEEETSVHCPDAVTFHVAAYKCAIPALAIVNVSLVAIQEVH